MNFKDLLIDSAIQAGIEVLKEAARQRTRSPASPSRPSKHKIKKKPAKKDSE